MTQFDRQLQLNEVNPEILDLQNRADTAQQTADGAVAVNNTQNDILSQHAQRIQSVQESVEDALIATELVRSELATETTNRINADDELQRKIVDTESSFMQNMEELEQSIHGMNQDIINSQSTADEAVIVNNIQNNTLSDHDNGITTAQNRADTAQQTADGAVAVNNTQNTTLTNHQGRIDAVEQWQADFNAGGGYLGTFATKASLLAEPPQSWWQQNDWAIVTVDETQAGAQTRNILNASLVWTFAGTMGSVIAPFTNLVGGTILGDATTPGRISSADNQGRAQVNGWADLNSAAANAFNGLTLPNNNTALPQLTRANNLNVVNIPLSVGGTEPNRRHGLMSGTDKQKLDGIANNANNYTHPVHAARTGIPTGNQSPAFGESFNIGQVTSDGSGHVTNIQNRTVTLPSLPATMPPSNHQHTFGTGDNNVTGILPVAQGGFANALNAASAPHIANITSNAALQAVIDGMPNHTVRDFMANVSGLTGANAPTGWTWFTVRRDVDFTPLGTHD